jgi:hypothetical protein
MEKRNKVFKKNPSIKKNKSIKKTKKKKSKNRDQSNGSLGSDASDLNRDIADVTSNAGDIKSKGSSDGRSGSIKLHEIIPSKVREKGNKSTFMKNDTALNESDSSGNVLGGNLDQEQFKKKYSPPEPEEMQEEQRSSNGLR